MDSIHIESHNESVVNSENSPTRNKREMVLWSTGIFFVDALFCGYRQFYELALLCFSLGCSSYKHHQSKETKHKRVSSVFAGLTSIYCIFQLYLCTNLVLYIVEFVCLMSTFFVWICCSYTKTLNYDKYHSLQHFIPSLWIVIIAQMHQSLIYIHSTTMGLTGHHDLLLVDNVTCCECL